MELASADSAVAPPLSSWLREWLSLTDIVDSGRALSRLLSRCPRGDGHPVMVIPGFMAGDRSTLFLRWFLRCLGYAPHRWRQGMNLGVSEELGERLLARVQRLQERAGRKVTLIGWSLGGIVARELARHGPESVRMVITLGSPFRGNPQATRAWPLYRALNSRHLHLLTPEAAARRAQPLPVPTTCLYSRRDGVVAWTCCTSLPAPQTENVPVDSSHLGYGHNLQALWVIADRLGQPEGEWEPYAWPHGPEHLPWQRAG